jgi:hypothetical protein
MPEAIAVLAAAQGAVTVPFDPPLTRDLVIVHRPGSPTPAAAAGWWWADPAAGYVLVYYAAREVREIFLTGH